MIHLFIIISMFLKNILAFHRSIQILPVSSVCFRVLLQRSLASKSTNFENTELEDSLPNHTWSKDSIKLFNKLNDLPGYSRRRSYLSTKSDEPKLFLRAVEERGKFLEYAFFVNPSLQSLKAVVQFGIFTSGIPGHVHGGAVASILDAAMACCVLDSLPIPGVTVNLNVNFKRSIPLNSSTTLVANIDKVEGRKVFTSASLKNADESEIYATSTAIFLTVTKKTPN